MNTGGVAWALFLLGTGLLRGQVPAPLMPSIAGTVVRADTNQPIPGVRVTATSTSNSVASVQTTTSDSQGRWRVTGLDAGSYRLNFKSPGFVTEEYGQNSFWGAPKPINVIEGQPIKDIVMPLMETATISGRILDSDGRFAPGVVVQLVRPVYLEPAAPTLLPVGVTRTDDRGEYRLFWITPGRYQLVAGRTDNVADFPGPAPSANDILRRYPATYYSGGAATLDMESATTLDLAPGVELNLSDLKFGPRLFRIRGRIIDSKTGAPPTTAVLSLEYSEGLSNSRGLYVVSTKYNAQDGTFEMADVVPGSYRVVISRSNEPPQYAYVEVRNTDVEGILLTLGSTGSSISGQFKFEGEPLSRAEVLPIGLEPAEFPSSSRLRAITPSVIFPDGRFRIDGLRNEMYRVVLSRPGPFYLKEARMNGVNLQTQPFEYLGMDSDNLELVFSRKVGQIDGVVRDDIGMPVPRAEVLLIPNTFPERFELYRHVVTDAMGLFNIQNIPPGDYRILAPDVLDRNRFDPGRLERSRVHSTAIRLDESAKETVALKLVPFGEQR